MSAEVPIRFHSPKMEEGILMMCKMHGIDFEYLSACVKEDWIVVEPGSVDTAGIDIGHERILESPSSRLDNVLYGALKGAARARGKPIWENPDEILAGVSLE